MKKGIATRVKRRVDRMEPGTLFGYDYFNIDQSSELQALAKALSRLERDGILVRISKGEYFKPKQSVFGPLPPSEAEIINALTVQNNKKVGYVTGLSAYNQMGLTTQVPNTIEIATKKRRRSRKIGSTRVKFVKREAPITKNNVQLLQMLDALKDIKNIPDTPVDQAFKTLESQIISLSPEKVKELVKLSFNYPPATRALVGATLEKVRDKNSVNDLYRSLNSLSKYKFGISKKLLPTKERWNIQ